MAWRREWTLGDTVVVPLGRPSVRDGTTVHPSVLWLIPLGSGWRLEQHVAQIPRSESFVTLAAACNRAIEIAQSFAPTERCAGCGLAAELDFGEHHTGADLAFWVSSRCENCAAQIESDGIGPLPEYLRQLERRRHGIWSVVVRRALGPAQWQAIRRELNLTVPALGDLKATLPGPIFVGTFAEAVRLCRILERAGVVAAVEQAGEQSVRPT